jgi:ATP-dependent Clp protease ATP-binding subunit ClpA
MPFRKLDITRKTGEATALATKLEGLIVGQRAPKDALLSVVDRIQSGFYDKTRPVGIFLFLGPTGTGKTGVAEAFTMGLFNNPKMLMKVDCAEFQHSHEIAKLVGSPPGYLGHRETHPYFTNNSLKAHRTDAFPFTPILFDEIEKASDSLWNLLLGILDKGTLTTGANEVVDMKPTIILMTSNVGASEMSEDKSLGFVGKTTVDDAKLESIALAAARRKFSPEFLNRIDYILNFKTLTEDELKQVLALQLQLLQDRIVVDSKVLFELRVSSRGLAQLLVDGYDRRYNARHLKRTIDKHISAPLTSLVATGQIMNEDVVIVDYLEGDWRYVAVPRANAPQGDFSGSLP